MKILKGISLPEWPEYLLMEGTPEEKKYILEVQALVDEDQKPRLLLISRRTGFDGGHAFDWVFASQEGDVIAYNKAFWIPHRVGVLIPQSRPKPAIATE